MPLSNFVTAAFLTLVALSASALSASGPRLYVSPEGNDAWSGTRSKAGDGDGPLATIEAACMRIRTLRAAGAPAAPASIEIVGTLRLQQPIELRSEDSNLVITGGTISGGRILSGWRVEEGRWLLDIPEAKNRGWGFGALWVNGERRTIARTPNQGTYFYRVGAAPAMPGPEGGVPQEFPKQAFTFRPGDIRTWERPEDAVVWVAQAWAFSGQRIARIDAEQNAVLFQQPAYWDFGQWTRKARYFVENHLEGLDVPGEWYLDREAGRLYYIPMPGETPETTEVIAPVAQQLLLVKGSAEKPVTNLRIEGVRFEHADWPLPAGGYNDPQAAHTIGGTLSFEWTQDSSMSGCTIARTGGYALALGDGCQRNTVSQCEAYDLGAGGLRVGAVTSPDGTVAGGPHIPMGNSFENNFLHHGGRIYREGVGVWIGYAQHTSVRHNDISNFYYTGVSNGWAWGYGNNSTHHTLIENNRIHHLGQGVLSDMGGIYNLGIQPGTVLRGNHIHDIRSYDYGGWGLYTDEGSSEMLLENNLVHHTTSGSFHQHYGRENIIRNNIFVYSRDELLMATRVEDHLSFTFEKNICIVDEGQVTNQNWTKAKIESRNNLFWNTGPEPLLFWKTPFAEWQAAGHEPGSIAADPGFTDFLAGDFRLRDDSPALTIGFQPWDYSAAGLRGEDTWKNKPAGLVNDPVEEKNEPADDQAAALPKPKPLFDDFEATALNRQPERGTVTGAYPPASITVSAETAQSGTRSLRFLDDRATPQPWEPELAYDLYLAEGNLRSRFDIYFEPGALLRYDLRQGNGIECVGPSVVVDQSGGLRVNDSLLATLPMKTWCTLELRCALGDAADGTFDLALGIERAAPQRFDNLKMACAGFRTAERAHFLAFSNLPVDFFIDNLSLTAE